MPYFNKRYHPPGTPPGTLREHEATETAAELRIRLIDYTDKEFVEKDLVTPNECQPYLARASNTWIHVQGQIEPERLQEFGNLFGLHPLALEDVLNTGQRPKADSYDDQLFVVMSLPVFREGLANIEQVSIFLGPNFLISFHKGVTDPFEPIRKRLRTRSGHMRSLRPDYLLYTLLDITVDEGFPVLEDVGEQIEALEDELLESPTKSTLRELHVLKRELLLLRRMLWPEREVLNILLRADQDLISDDTKLYLRDCYDHTVQIMDLLESYRDMTANMLDVYLSSVSNRLNEIMRVLTVIATIFIPLTFVVGVYGMNFGNNISSPWAMPELRMYYGYPIVWLIMIAIAVGMLLIFKRRKWF